MKKKFNNFITENLNNSKSKMKSIVDNALLKNKGGNNYFNYIDSSLKTYKNIDLIKTTIEQIKKDTNNNFNLILTGGFGDWVLILIKKGIISIPNSLILVNGSIRGKNNKLNKITYGKVVNIVYKIGDIYNKDYILIDDSYYSGSTKNAIDKFLKKINSKIIKTYVLYDGNDKINNNRTSLYRYYNYHNGTILNVNNLLNYLYQYDYLPIFNIEKNIINGNIKTIRQINYYLNKLNKNIDINSYNRKDELKFESHINENNDKKIELLFLPSGEIFYINLSILSKLISFETYKINYNKILNIYWDHHINYFTIKDKKRDILLKYIQEIKKKT